MTDAASHNNRLAAETSPYLLQHKSNPVDWWPWGPAALKQAKDTGKPILLSVGYAACHWCHVMAHESFEDDATAAVMNELFVNIKVDREERPDLDEIYMAATQMLSRQGGWPNSVFLTPDLEPFFAGTYFPPEARYGRPGFPDILRGVADAYATKREEIGKVASEVAEQIRSLSEMTASKEAVGPKILSRAFGELAGRFDPAHGGFGGAPKFPHSMDVAFLLRYHRRVPGETTQRVTTPLPQELFIIGSILTLFLVFWVVGTLQYDRMETPPADAMTVYVTAKQWMWRFSYPDGRSSMDVLTVPAGKPVKLVMTSRDVIHSFYVPAFRMKQDVVPGRYYTAWFEAKGAGNYTIDCAEFCGVNHSRMLGEVSMTSRNRSVDALASSVIARSWPNASTGLLTRAAVAKNATSAPTESRPLAASGTPIASSTARMPSGRAPSAKETRDSVRALATSVSRSCSACATKSSSASSPRPNALSTRMPCTDSSTVVARSPAWSRARRATTL